MICNPTWFNFFIKVYSFFIAFIWEMWPLFSDSDIETTFILNKINSVWILLTRLRRDQEFCFILHIDSISILALLATLNTHTHTMSLRKWTSEYSLSGNLRSETLTKQMEASWNCWLLKLQQYETVKSSLRNLIKHHSNNST